MRMTHISPSSSFSMLAQQAISTAERQHRFATAQNYRTALHSLLSFLRRPDIPFSLVTADTLVAWRLWLRECGCCQNTAVCYLRSLRAVYHKVLAASPTATAGHRPDPFAGLSMAMSVTAKRAVNEDELHRLIDLPLRTGSHLSFVRDLFLFCFYAMGMPFVDVAYLRPSQIRDGWLTYERHKTGQRVRVEILPPMQTIIQRWADPSRPYLFPLITSTDPDTAHREYRLRLRSYNDSLRVLTRRACLSRPLTSYVPRHSWASLAYSHEVPLPVISQALGHRNSNTTLFYIRSIDDCRLADANRRLIEQLL